MSNLNKNDMNILNKALRYISKFKAGKKLLDDIDFLIEAIKENPLKYSAIVLAALAYLINPVDVAPDVIPIAGLADDAAVIAGAVATIKKMMGS